MQPKWHVYTFLMLLCVNVYAQEEEQIPYNMGSQNDTLTLTTFQSATTLVAYKFDSVTLFVHLADFSIEFDELWNTYKRESKWHTQHKSDQAGRILKTWRFLDSIRAIMNTRLRAKDTLFLSRKSFRSANLGDLIDFFPAMIDKNRCTIVDTKGQIHLSVVRQKGGCQVKGGGFGGRRYFLPGASTYFIEAIDWEAD